MPPAPPARMGIMPPSPGSHFDTNPEPSISIPLHHPTPSRPEASAGAGAGTGVVGPSRPKSSSSSTLASARHAPYMVALSGWPEPVYIDSSRSDWGRRSRPGTPRQSAGEVRDGVVLPPRGGSPVQGILSSGMGTGMGGQKALISPRGSPKGSGARTPHRPGTASPRRLPSPERGSSPSPFPTSSARSSAQEPPNQSGGSGGGGGGGGGGVGAGASASPTAFGAGMTPPSVQKPFAPPPVPNRAAFTSRGPTSGPRQGHFFDPRLAPHVAVMHNRGALRVAPAWSSPPTNQTSPLPTSPPTSSNSMMPPASPAPAQSGQGIRVPAGSRGTGILVMRAVPDVYPPPSAAHSNGSPDPTQGMGMGMGMGRPEGLGGFAGQMARLGNGMGMATEVYPRDPELGFLWGATSPASGLAAGMGMGVGVGMGMASGGKSPGNGSSETEGEVKVEAEAEAEAMDVDKS
ncbi:hypothetical protein JCM24511_06685 [Saitozyma sp. JCM 24511]|nr:hypothetical protein JCM24511_06685 [Saitozyma sp. JCM 24511]